MIVGAFVSGLWAEERNVTAVIQRARSWFLGMNVLWKQILDLTYPYTAMFKGTAFNREIENTFKERQIEVDKKQAVELIHLADFMLSLVFVGRICGFRTLQ